MTAPPTQNTPGHSGSTLQKNRNALAAAGELHIHKSTFFYRLGKMADLFGIDINDGLALFRYEYSFRVLDYLGLE